MATRLYAVSGTYGKEAKLRSTDHPGDDISLPPFEVVHTGGKDHDFIDIPISHDQGGFNEHHLRFYSTDGSWSILVGSEVNPGQDHTLFWTTDGWSDRHVLPGSQGKQGITLFIDPSRPGDFKVNWMNWDPAARAR